MKLIDKEALVAEIEKLKDSEPYYPTLAEKYAYNNGVNDSIDKIHSLEVKEVDLEKEYEEFVVDDPIFGHFITNDTLGIELAKHFFELGLKAQKGE